MCLSLSILGEYLHKEVAMKASIYCSKCKSKSEISPAGIIYLVSNGSAYVCSDCKINNLASKGYVVVVDELFLDTHKGMIDAR